MQSTLRVGRLLGIPIEIHASWLFVFGLIVWSLGADYFPMHHSGVDGATNWLGAVVTALLFFISVVVHELAHSLTARAHGIPVERITLFALGGVSGLKGEASRPRSQLAVAAAGPLASLVLAGALWLVFRVVVDASMTAGAVAFYLAYGNLALGLLNLIPGFPLDGGRVLRAFLWARSGDLGSATIRAVRLGRVAAAGLALAGIWQVLTSVSSNGLWLMLVGWFLWSAAENEGARLLVSSRLQGRSILPMVRFDFVALDGDETIAQAVTRVLDAPPQALYPVLANDGLIGVVTTDDLRVLDPERWGATKMHWVARRARPVPTIDLGSDPLEALTKLDAFRVDGLPVRDGSAGLVAILERSALMSLVEAVSAGI